MDHVAVTGPGHAVPEHLDVAVQPAGCQKPKPVLRMAHLCEREPPGEVLVRGLLSHSIAVRPCDRAHLPSSLLSSTAGREPDSRPGDGRTWDVPVG